MLSATPEGLSEGLAIPRSSSHSSAAQQQAASSQAASKQAGTHCEPCTSQLQAKIFLQLMQDTCSAHRAGECEVIAQEGVQLAVLLAAAWRQHNCSEPGVSCWVTGPVSI